MRNLNIGDIIKISGAPQRPIPKDQKGGFLHNLKDLFILRVEQERCKQGNDYVISPNKTLECPVWFKAEHVSFLWTNYYKPKINTRPGFC